MDEILGSLTKNDDSLMRVKQTQGFVTQIKNFMSENDEDGNRKLDEAEFIKAMKRFATTTGVEEAPTETEEEAEE